MALFKTSNPALGPKTFDSFGSYQQGDVMTLQGTVNKTAILLVLVMIPAFGVWNLFYSGGVALMFPLMLGGAIGGLICSLIIVFKKEWSPTVAPIYAILEGLFVGAISAFYSSLYEGIVMQAILLTFGILASLLFLYKSRIIRVTENFKLIVASATMGIALTYLISMVLGFFGMEVPLIHSNGLVGIIFSLVCVATAAANLVMDFDFIEQGAERNAPKYMEWYAAFGLMVTLIWLYIEILRLLSKLRSRN
ncbi:MAG TPA: Bax inhibitor-1/YccA family protein [Cytophagaceae bacterium]|nr:Bax inhibitor-1/YccA family protein [Cytophagaceae bacterium]